MTNWFSKGKWAYWAVVLVMCFINVYWIHNDIMPLLAVAIIDEICFSTAVRWINRSNAKEEAAMLSLVSECRYTEFIRKYGSAHAKDTRKGPSTVAYFHLASVYMSLGDRETSLSLFKLAEPKTPESIHDFPKGKVRNAVIDCASYHINIACAYLLGHDTEKAGYHVEQCEHYWRQLQEMAKKDADLEKDVRFISNALTTRKLELALELGEPLDYEAEIQKLEEKLDETTPLSRKVYNKCLQGRLYQKWGKPAEVENCREFIRKCAEENPEAELDSYLKNLDK